MCDIGFRGQFMDFEIFLKFSIVYISVKLVMNCFKIDILVEFDICYDLLKVWY